MVTRGLYPRLVRRNVKKHLETMNAVGVEDFIIEVVTVCLIKFQNYSSIVDKNNK